MDCLEGMKYIEDKSIDMILCDLPYGTTKCKWDSIIDLEELWKQYNRIIKDNGAIVLTSDEPFTTILIHSNLKMFRYKWIWDKVKPNGFLNAKKMPLKRYEEICVFYKALPTYNPKMEKGKMRNKKAYNKNAGSGEMVYGKFENLDNWSDEKYPTNIIEISNASQKDKFHPTQKPVQLFEYLIKTYTNEGDIVLDNCIGSGTTAIASINTNRKYIGFELEKEYYEASLERIKNHYELLSKKSDLSI
jgi:DNA modification methylase